MLAPAVSMPSFFLRPFDQSGLAMGMTMDTDIEQQIGRAAANPAKVSGDAGTVEQQPLKDLIEADKYLAHKQASRQRGLGGIKLVQLIPPGAV